MFNRYAVKLDGKLYKRAKEFSREQGYSSLKEFIEHLIRKELDREDKNSSGDETRKRLKGLGYISD